MLQVFSAVWSEHSAMWGNRRNLCPYPPGAKPIVKTPQVMLTLLKQCGGNVQLESMCYGNFES